MTDAIINSKSHKASTNKILRGYFEVSFPTRRERMKREADVKDIRDRSELARFDLEIIEEEKESYVNEAKDAARERLDDWVDIAKECRTKIAELASQSRVIEDEIMREMTDYNLLLFIQQVKAWGYKDEDGKILPLPSSLEELESFGFDDRLLELFSSETVRVYDDEDLKKG